jgi:hypothetical protein
MANARGRVYLNLLGFWLLFSVVKVRVDTGLAQQHYEKFALPARGAPPPAAPCELRFPLLFFLSSKEFSGLWIGQPAVRLKRRRGGRAAIGEHHFHSPSTSQPPAHRSRRDRKRAPSLISPGALLTHTLSAREIIIVAKGAGAYLALIYLVTIEKNPGPPTFSKEQEKFLDSMGEKITANIKQSLVELVGELTVRLDRNEKSLEALRTENTSLHNRLTHLERQARRNNIVIFGVPDNMQPEAALQKVAKERLGLDEGVEIESAYRFGRQTEKRPILVKLCSQQDKQDIMANVRKLKGTRIVITDDLTPEEQATRRTILGAAWAAKDKGIVCKVRRTGLLVNDRLVPVAELCNETWMERLAGAAGAAGGAQPQKRSRAAIATPPGQGGSSAPTSEDFWGAPPAGKKDKPSGNKQGAPQTRSSSLNRNDQ